MNNATYETRRGELETYFGRTAADKWVAMTSTSPVSRIRATVRAGREEMRATLLSWLPEDLSGARILDAGCGTGMLTLDMAARGADVVGVDLSEALISEARARTAETSFAHQVTYHAGDMTDPALGQFDYVVAMDSFIHYPMKTILDLIAGFAPRTGKRMVFTFAPRTTMLAIMHMTGKVFPRDNRSPAIVPVSESKIADAISQAEGLQDFGIHRTRRVSSAFYKSQALELVRR